MVRGMSARRRGAVARLERASAADQQERCEGGESISRGAVAKRIRLVPPTGPSCPACTGQTFRAVRAHSSNADGLYYVISVRWSCGQCGYRFGTHTAASAV